MKEQHVKTIQDKVNRMNSFFAAKAESLYSDGQEGVLNHSRYDELKGNKIQDLQNTLQNKETARLQKVKEEKEMRAKRIFDNMIFANKKMLGEQTQYVAQKHTERFTVPNKTRYNGKDGSPLQRFSPQQM